MDGMLTLYVSCNDLSGLDSLPIGCARNGKRQCKESIRVSLKRLPHLHCTVTEVVNALIHRSLQSHIELI